jgi:hypothetical protein
LIAIIVGAALSNCAEDSGRYSTSYPTYHPFYDPNGPEKCRALQSLIEAHERYGIVAPSQETDLEALRRCGLPYSYGGGRSSEPILGRHADTAGCWRGDGDVTG